MNSVILIPAYQYIEPETDEILRRLETRYGWRIERRFGGSAIDVARCAIATWAVLQGFEWIYWIDSDIHFAVRDFQTLSEMDGPFCCAPYQQRQANGSINVLSENEIPKETRGIVEVEAAGFGFVKSHRSIYEAMVQKLTVCKQTPDSGPFIPFFQPRIWLRPDGRHCYYGEDYSFCLHARELGFNLKANFDIEIGHIGRYAFRLKENL